MLNWIFLTARKASVGLFVRVHMETFRLFKFRNVGQKFSQNTCDQAKRSNLTKHQASLCWSIFCPI